METTFTHIKPSWERERERQMKKKDVSIPKPNQEKDKKSINSISGNKTNTSIKMTSNETVDDVTSIFFWQNYFNNLKITLL